MVTGRQFLFSAMGACISFFAMFGVTFAGVLWGVRGATFSDDPHGFGAFSRVVGGFVLSFVLGLAASFVTLFVLWRRSNGKLP